MKNLKRLMASILSVAMLFSVQGLEAAAYGIPESSSGIIQDERIHTEVAVCQDKKSVEEEAAQLYESIMGQDSVADKKDSDLTADNSSQKLSQNNKPEIVELAADSNLNDVNVKNTQSNREILSPMEYSWTTKETPLINLAGDLDKMEGVNLGITADTVKVTAYGKNLFEGSYNVSGKQIEIQNEELLLDGDKYNAVPYNALLESGKKNQDVYYEEGIQVTPKSGEDGVWVRVDLGSEYPVEVINLKRGIYVDGEVGNEGHGDGNGRGSRLKNYSEAIILAGSREDGSDAYVVHYDVPDGTIVYLPQGVAIPDTADRENNYYQETMGGGWYYMDQSTNGKGYTPIGTTQNAQYMMEMVLN